jgi:hypothetical protein
MKFKEPPAEKRREGLGKNMTYSLPDLVVCTACV